MKKTKTALLHSGLALLLCISMLIGSTFAWFSDSVSGGKNVITAGNLDLEMYWTDDINGEWHNVEENGYNTIFSYDNWEPGYTDVKYIKLVNAGDLALNYKLSLTPQNGVGKLAEVINVYYAEGGVAVEQRDDLKNLQAIGLLNNVLNGGATADGTLLAADQYSPLHPSGEVVMTVAMNMLTTAGNDYMNEDAGLFSIIAIATQAQFEKDSFGDDYDADAQFPNVLVSGSASASVTPVDNKVPAGGVTLSGSRISAYVPEGVVLEDGTTELNLTVTPLKKSASDITAVNNEMLIPVDVHIDGVSENNTVPIVIDLGEILPKYLNMGNYHLYHVEDGTNNEMVLVGDKANLTAHNQYTYDPITGAVSVAMASFSEVTFLSETTAKWKGGEDYTWYNTTDTNLNIANADQLHAFSKIVGGMAENVDVDTFSGKTVTLLSDINLNNGTVLGEGVQGTTKTIFYPIGYNNNKAFTSGNEVNRPTETYTGVTSEVNAFEGTFDGNGHTISNFYQNTWEMFGDYNSGYSANSNYYKDAMGLFAWVDGTVKNLTVDNFESDGEFTPTGVIAAYAGYNGNATFENIAITNCNPRVYNTGNGGIVGIAGEADTDVKQNLEFNNITVDKTNTITALWGSWDVACGGIVGMYRGDTADTISFTNCHVAAQIDVFNDVCGNYQYYWYRYSGMIIGTIFNMKEDGGYTVPDLTGVSATGCTVRFDEWNDYYYCELVDNSLASYTHDHQFSRLVEVKAVDGTTITPLEGTSFQVPSTGRYNYVVVTDKETPSTEEAKCYHFVDGVQHLHESKGKETVGGNEVLVEDKQHYYLPFNQLFTGYGWGVKHVPIVGAPGDKLQGYDNLDIKILDRVGSSEVKFKSKFTGDFLYRVGNQNTVSIDSLFEENGEVAVVDSGVWVTVEKIDENMNVGGTFTADKSNWTNGTIKFNGTGVVKVTIQDYNYCTPTVLYLEVVEAQNAKTATSATSNNVVLLNDVSGTFSVTNGYTFYGNGFTVTLPKVSVQNVGSGFTGYISIGASQDDGIANGGNLDNVRIEGPVYPEMYIYRDQAKITSSSDSDYGDGNNMRYFKNSVIVYGGNCTISNCYISGSRTALCLRGGNNVVIENTTLSGGAYANMQICAGSNVTLRDLTTVQTDVGDSYGKGKKAHGLGIAVDSSVVDINIEGELNQYNWLNGTQWNNIVPSAYQSVFPNFFKDNSFSKYWHYLNGGTDPYVNLAFVFACNWDTGRIHDNRTTINYETCNATIAGVSGGVYSKVNTVGGNAITQKNLDDPGYTSSGFNTVAPVFKFDNTANNDADDANDAADTYCVYNESSGTLRIGVSGSSKTIDLSGVSVTKNGVALAHTTYLNGTQINDNSVTIKSSDGAKQTLTFKATNNEAGYDKEGNAIAGSTEYTWTVNVEIAVLSYPAPVWNMGGDYQFDTSNCYYPYYSMSQGYGEAVPIYEGIKISYYDKSGKPVNLDLSGTTTLPTGSNNSNSNAFTYTLADGSVLTMKFSSGWKSGATTHQFTNYNNKIYIYPQSLDNDNYVRAKTTNQDFDVKITYTFTDPNGQSTGDQTMQWYNAKASNGNVSTVQWKTFDSTNGKEYSICVTPDTLITLADGSQKEIQNVTPEDMFIVWDFYNGKYTVMPSSIIMNHGYNNYDVVTLNFDDGTVINTINGHGFFDAGINKFVIINKYNVNEYIGHSFVKDAENNTTAKLVSYSINTEYTESWSILTAVHYNCILEGMLTITPAEVEGSSEYLMPYEVGADMKYDEAKMQADIERYGLYTYDDFAEYCTYEQFVGFGLENFKVSVAKGYITWDEIKYLLSIHIG